MATVLDAGPGSQGQAQDIASLPPALAIIKMENDNFQALAAAHPRDHKAVMADIRAQLEAYPSFAQEAIYSKPVGKIRAVACRCGAKYEAPLKGDLPECPQCHQLNIKSTKVIEKRVRNLSIRAAEAVAEAYGYNRVRSSVTPLKDGLVQVEATFTDFQRCRIWQDSGIISQYQTGRDKKTFKIAEDRFYGVVVKAEISRRIREVILRSVPPGLRSELLELAEAKNTTALTDEKRDKIILTFKKFGVTLEMLEEHLGSPLLEWTESDRLDLLGIHNALKDGETTVADVFYSQPDVEPSRETPPPPNLDDLVNPQEAPSKPVETPQSTSAPEREPGDEPAGSATLPADELPATLRPMIERLAKCQTKAQATKIYDEWCGPESTVPQELRDVAQPICLKRMAELPDVPGKNGGSKQKDLIG